MLIVQEHNLKPGDKEKHDRIFSDAKMHAIVEYVNQGANKGGVLMLALEAHISKLTEIDRIESRAILAEIEFNGRKFNIAGVYGPSGTKSEGPALWSDLSEKTLVT